MPKKFCFNGFFCWIILTLKNVIFIEPSNLFRAEVKNSSGNLPVSYGSLSREKAVHKSEKIQKKLIFFFNLNAYKMYYMSSFRHQWKDIELES